MPRMYYFLLGIICALLTSSGFLAAQVKHSLQPEIISAQEGLPQAFVPSIIQDKQGFIWMATRDGLCRYDGRYFKIFQPDPSGKPSLSFTGISKIVLDSHGNIWILTEQGTIDKFNPYTEQFINISKHPLFKKTIGNSIVNDFLVENENRFWAFSFTKGILCLDFESGKSEMLPLPKHEKNESWVNRVPVLSKDKKGRIWLNSASKIFYFDRTKKEFITYPDQLQKPFVAGQAVIGSMIVHPKTGELFIVTTETFIVLNPISGTRKTFPLQRKLWKAFVAMAVDDLGNVYFSDEGLLQKFSLSGGLETIADYGSKLWDCRSLFVDDSQVLWMGTTGGGLRKFNLTKSSFQTYNYKKDFIEDLLAVAMKVPGNGQAIYPKSASGYNFRSYFDEKRERLWYSVGGAPAIVYGVKSGGKEISRFAFPENVIASNEHIYPVFGDPKGNIFVFRDFTFFVYSETLQRFLPIKTTIDPLRTGVILQVVADNKYFWLCTKEKGLFRYDRKTSELKQYHHQAGNTKSISSDALLCLFTDPMDSNRLWIGTFGSGLCAFDKTTGTSRRISINDGLPNNVVYSAIPDALGDLWIGTNKGLSRMNRKTYKIQTYTVEDGLLANEFNRFHYVQLSGGYILMGGIEGYTGFDPKKRMDDKFSPAVELVQLRVNNRIVIPGTHSPLAGLPIHAVQEIILPYDQNFLTFDFAALQFNEIKKCRHRYQMEGVDRGWTETYEPRAIYTNLNPGFYTLRLNSSNTSGKWSPYVRTLKIVITPPLWATWWAFTLCALSVAGILFWQFRSYATRLRIKQAMMHHYEETEQLKAADEIKTRFFSNITHEFRTPLTLIMTPTEQLKLKLKDPDDQRKLASIDRNANHLLSLINQLLDLSKLEASAMPVYEVKADLGAFLEQTLHLFKQQAQRRGINLMYDNFGVNGYFYFDVDKIGKVIHNLVFNALKFTTKGGTIKLTLARGETGTVVIEVIDSGIGIPSEKLSRIFDRFFQVDNSATREGTGIGLAFVQETIHLLKGEISVSSALGQGTTFTISLPLLAAEEDENKIGTTSLVDNEHFQTSSEEYEIQVLIVEDNQELASYISESLPRHYKITHAFDGITGFEQATKKLHDLIISDVLMPEMDGYTLCGLLKKDIRTSHIPVVLLTAKSTTEDRMEGLEHGADDYLSKPFQMRELQLRVRNILETRKKQRERMQAGYISLKSATDANNLTLNDPFLIRLYELIDLHIDESSFGVEQLSNRMGISRIHLYRKIKTLTGFTATELLRNYRLKKALIHLRSGYSITQAGSMVGFDTPSYFTKCFRELYDLTPTDFLSQIRNN